MGDESEGERRDGEKCLESSVRGLYEQATAR